MLQTLFTVWVTLVLIVFTAATAVPILFGVVALAMRFRSRSAPPATDEPPKPAAFHPDCPVCRNGLLPMALHDALDWRGKGERSYLPFILIVDGDWRLCEEEGFIHPPREIKRGAQL
jgi:hypothetical protein